MQKIRWCETYAHFCYHHNYKNRWYTLMTWMMGGRRAGPRPRSTYPNYINNFSNIEQVRVVDLFRPTYMFCTVTPTISSLGGIVAGMEPISNPPITTNIISWKSQHYTMFTLVRWLMVAGQRLISAYPFKIKSCYLIARGILAGILWPRSTSINLFYTITRGRVSSHTWPTSTTSAMTWGKVAGIKRPMPTTFTIYMITWGTVVGLKRHMSTTFLTKIHFNKFIFRTFVVNVTTVGGRMCSIPCIFQLLEVAP